MHFNSNDEKHTFIINLILTCKKIEIKSIINHYLKISELISKVIKQQEYSKLKIGWIISS
jgi:hypothetical protein